MKLLRTDLDDSTLSKLSEAVQQADRHNLPYSDSNIEQQLDIWMEGLVANEQVRAGRTVCTCKAVASAASAAVADLQ
jgi:hypothetical protein